MILYSGEKPINIKTFVYDIADKILDKNIVNIYDNIQFNPTNYTIQKDGKSILLTKKQQSFLQLLIKNAKNVTTYEQIEQYLWQDKFMTKDALKTFSKVEFFLSFSPNIKKFS